MKKVLSLVLSTVLVLGLSGCAAQGKSSTGSKDSKVIKVGASPEPHAKILEQVKPLLEKEGYKLEIKEFTDYVIPNTALAEGEIDANFFQHIPYLEKTKKEKGLDLDYTVKVHIEPMGLYSSKIKNINDLKEGAEIAIPNDPTNSARALRLLEKNNIIKLKDGDLVTSKDIVDNPKKLKISEIDAAQLPRVLPDVTAAIINTNYALEGKLNPLKDALIIESGDSPYANILAVRKNNKDSEAIKALSKALTSPEVKKYIEDTYKGSIVPAF